VKAQLGSSAKNEDVGRIVLDQLCPAVHAILLDGLKTHVRSFFGKVKNSAWKVVEDSIDMGKLMYSLVFDFITTSTVTVLRPLYRMTYVSQHPELRTEGFCCGKVVLPTCPC